MSRAGVVISLLVLRWACRALHEEVAAITQPEFREEASEEVSTREVSAWEGLEEVLPAGYPRHCPGFVLLKKVKRGGGRKKARGRRKSYPRPSWRRWLWE
ncbi:hypothetical protein Adeg_1182 [Ammonifex degensii KC4]|uniref:Uncharacterized protein n=1 Tax=Ammonifex degensii (strain DSM 10501 / KC4) TaxID=429009 RepID=C9R7L6_AMMDK|nr:hypothetical protein Adeg_1182 [Ammonifex degensii KC4]